MKRPYNVASTTRQFLSACLVTGLLLAIAPVAFSADETSKGANPSLIEKVRAYWNALWTSQTRIHGYVDAALPLMGASVEIFDRDGKRVAQAEQLTTARGYFEASIDGKNGPYRFVAQGGTPGEDIPDSGLIGVYPIEDLRRGPAYINTLSTIIDAFDGEFDDIRERLGIPEWISASEAIEGARGERPYFSPESFVRMSRHHGGIPGLIALLKENPKGPGAETRILLFPSERAYSGTTPALELARKVRFALKRESQGDFSSPLAGGLFESLIPHPDRPEYVEWTDSTAAEAEMRLGMASSVFREIRERMVGLRGEVISRVGGPIAERLYSSNEQRLESAFGEIDAFHYGVERFASTNARRVNRRDLVRFRNDLISASLGARRSIRKIHEALTGERAEHQERDGALREAALELVRSGGEFAALEALYLDALGHQLQAAVLLSEAYRSVAAGERMFRDYLTAELFPMLDRQSDAFRSAAEQFAMRDFPGSIDFAVIERSDFVTQMTDGAEGVVTGRIFAFTKSYVDTVEKWLSDSFAIGDIRPADAAANGGAYGIQTASFDQPDHCFFINVQGKDDAPEIQVGYQCDYRIFRFAIPVTQERRHVSFLNDPVSGRTKEAVIHVRKHETPGAVMAARLIPPVTGGGSDEDSVQVSQAAPAMIEDQSVPPLRFGFYGDAFGLSAIGKKKDLSSVNHAAFRRLGRMKCSQASYSAGEYQYNTSDETDREVYPLKVLGDRKVKLKLITQPRPSGYLKEVLTARYDGTTPTRASRFDLLRSEFVQTPTSETKILGGVHIVESGGKAEEITPYLRQFNPRRRTLDDAMGMTRGTVTLTPDKAPYMIGFTHRLETKGRSRACRYRIEALSCLKYDRFEVQLELAD